MRPDQLGQQLREQLQGGPEDDRQRLARQQRRLLEEVTARRAQGWRRPALAAVTAGVLLVASAGILLWVNAEPALECRTDSGRVLAEGDWVEAPAGQVELSFTEGSVTQLERRSRVRLSRNDASETRLTLESGKLQAKVHHGGRAWTFQAGPYRVRVTGTRLAISWDLRRQQFEVSVSEGEVQVFGEGIAVAGLAVRRGERLKADRRRGEINHLRRVKPAPSPDAGGEQADPPAIALDAATPDLQLEGGPALSGPGAERRSRRQRRDTGARWQRLAGEGDFSGALKVVQGIGLSRVLRRSSADDLLLLADAGRLGGKPALARRTLITVRKRFPRARQGQLKSDQPVVP